ncbi:hypothetical protein AT05_03290 [Schleiferia thermophila str. Yellowstone]|nr:hypothetical protein AT05_03290 [Schleiferia thermophila str. Yellowstone]
MRDAEGARRAVRSTGAKRTPEQPDPARKGRKAGAQGHALRKKNPRPWG